MAVLITIFLLPLLNVANADVDNLDVKYIAETIIQSQKEAFTYDLPDNAFQYRATNRTLTDYGTFDYIIVGAGAAGAILATRLSENEDTTILLLEAGDRPTTFANIPGMKVYTEGTKFNWNFKSIPQNTSCLGMVDRQCTIPRGKALGGSTVINGLIYSRGNKYDYDSWANGGNRGWSYNEVLPYFKKSENSQVGGDSAYHGKGGLLNVEYTKPNTTVFNAYIAANKELGRKVVDYNGKEELGVARCQHNIVRGQRLSNERAFLQYSGRRTNLNILPYSYATKVEINGKKVAQGVLFDHKGQSLYAKAKKEVVLSAGPISTPQLLMQSGIGPSKLLESLKIPIVANLPVGENYQDHATFWGLFLTTNHTNPIKTVYENSREYLDGYGTYAISAGEGIGFFRTKSAETPISVPNIELLLLPSNYSLDFDQIAFNYNNVTFNEYWSKYNPGTDFRLLIVLLSPKSRGTVKLKSSNPYEYPLIDTNFLSDKDGKDIEAIYEGINLVKEILNTTAFRKLNAQILDTIVPNCKNYTDQSKEQWFCQIRHITSHLYHSVGTCKMAPLSKGGVVDNELKVHGIKKLRIVDASIMPDVIKGHTSAPTMMIAEKIADLLKRN